MKQKQVRTTYWLCTTALFMAITCIFTMFIRVPIPLGYAHLGNSIILLAVFFYDAKSGILAGSIGSALADLLLGFNEWILPTLLIKAMLAATAVLLGMRKGKFRLKSLRTVIAVLASMTVMVLGYVVSGMILYRGLEAGLSSAPGLIAEGFVNGIAFFFFAIPCSKAMKKGAF